MKKIIKSTVAVALALLMGTAMISCGSENMKEQEKTPEEYLGLKTDDLWQDRVNETPTFTVNDTVSETTAITLHTYETDEMVLQRRAVNIISGYTTDSHVAVNFNGVNYYGQVENGEFKVYLPPMETCKDLTLTVYTDSAKKVLDGVCVGEVFLVSGQSNAKWSINSCGATYSAETALSDDAYLRLLDVNRVDKEQPASEVSTSGWVKSKPSTVGTFSAVGYLMGKELRNTLKVPVGIISSSVGGTLTCYWSEPTEYAELVKTVKTKTVANHPEGTASLGFNGMIAPLKDVRVRSVVWYQGESNATNCDYYAELGSLIEGWRKYFGYTLPFVVIGLPRYNDTDYSPIREAQQKITEEKFYCFLSVNIDNGDAVQIHPLDKTVLSQRAAQTVCGYLFNKEKPLYPTVKSITHLSDNKIKIEFDNIVESIVFKNGMNGFEYSSSEKGLLFHEFDSYEISGNDIILTAPETVKFVRYGYKRTFKDDTVNYDVTKQVTVYNSLGYPLDQFKTEIE